MRFILPKFVLQRARNMGGKIESEIHDFIDAKVNGTQPRYLDKPCGYDRLNNITCQMHVDLKLGHYRLTGGYQPLLIYQDLHEFLFLISISRHNDIFEGGQYVWCHQHQRIIDWEGNEDHLHTINEMLGELED